MGFHHTPLSRHVHCTGWEDTMARMDRRRSVLLQLPADVFLAPGTDNQEIATAYITVVLLKSFVLCLESKSPCCKLVSLIDGQQGWPRDVSTPETQTRRFPEKEPLLDVCFVSPTPGERHARAGGHPVPMALGSWIPAFAGMTPGRRNWQRIDGMDIWIICTVFWHSHVARTHRTQDMHTRCQRHKPLASQAHRRGRAEAA
jgi:hypothetical protein